MDFNKLNDKSKFIKRAQTIAGIVCGVSFFMAFVSIVAGLFSLILICIISTIFSAITIIALNISHKNSVDDEIFNKYILPMLKTAFDDLKYNELVGISREVIYNLPFIDTGDHVTTLHMLEGYYRNVSFVQSGIRCSETYRDSDGDSHTKTVFSGRVIIIGTSLFDEEGYVDIKLSNMFCKRELMAQRKVTLNHSIESLYDIYVSNEGISIPRKILDYINDLANTYPEYKICFRLVSDRIYIVIEDINPRPYSIAGLGEINQKNVDLIIKKDSSFITNTISLILDK